MARTPPPRQTAEQRAAALARANEVRIARAEMKKRMARSKRPAARRLAAAALERDTARLKMPDGTLDTMRIIDLLVAVPKIGRVKANRALVNARISPSKTLAGLTYRQRDELRAALDLPQHPNERTNRQ